MTTEINHKYKIGDKVWFFAENKSIETASIEEIKVTITSSTSTIRYFVNSKYNSISEYNLHSTETELLKTLH